MIQAAEARELRLNAMRTPEQEEALEFISDVIRNEAEQGRAGVEFERELTDVEMHDLTMAGYTVFQGPGKSGVYWAGGNNM